MGAGPLIFDGNTTGSVEDGIGALELELVAKVLLFDWISTVCFAVTPSLSLVPVLILV